MLLKIITRIPIHNKSSFILTVCLFVCDSHWLNHQLSISLIHLWLVMHFQSMSTQYTIQIDFKLGRNIHQYLSWPSVLLLNPVYSLPAGL